MIFDTPEMERLRKRYASVSDFRVPRIIYLDRDSQLAGERFYLEDLFASAPQQKWSDWLHRLVNDDEAQHLGAWFEIILYGWLQEIGPVIVAPGTEGDDPDMALMIGSQTVVIEANVHLLDPTVRQGLKYESEIMDTLGRVEKPYAVRIVNFRLNDTWDPEQLAHEVTSWLEGPDGELHKFRDASGNEITLSANHIPELTHVAAMGQMHGGSVNAEPLKPPLRRKAGQHKKVRGAGYPYVLAMLLEPIDLSAKEVATAWFGATQIVIDLESREVKDVRTDASGLHFFGRGIQYTSVSGTLVFRTNWNPDLGRHELVASYIENPFARVPLDPAIFPVGSRFVVVQRGPTSLTMQWQSSSKE
jgi:hypothetical protein